jgi:hypothetical protein
LLLPDPTDDRSGLVRANKVFANTLFSVHTGSANTGRQLGRDTLSLAFLNQCFEDLRNLGLDMKPWDNRESLKEEVLRLVAPDPSLFTPRDHDWSMGAVEQRAGGITSMFDHIPYVAPHGSNGCLAEVSDIFHYVGNFLMKVDRTTNSFTGRVTDFLINELEKHDSALVQMDRKVKGNRALALLNKAPTPRFLSTYSDSVEITYAGIAERVAWAYGTEIERERVLLNHALELCDDERLPRLKSLLMEGPCPVRTNSEAAEMMLRVARLIKSSAFENRHLTLQSYSAAFRLEEYLNRERGVFERDTIRALMPGERVAALEQKQAVLETSWRTNNSSGGATTRSTGFPREMLSELNRVVSDVASMELEERLERMLGDHNSTEMDICDAITRSGHTIYLKVLLGHLDWISIRPIFGKIVARVRPVWERYATMVLVAGIDSWRTATDRQSDFEMNPGVLDKLKTDASKVSIINDIVRPIMDRVQNAAELPPKSLHEQLTSAVHREQEREMGDRVFWLLGYRSETLTRNDDELADSFAAVMDTLTDFLKEGAPLGGARKKRHEELALKFYTKARLEHQLTHKSWAESKDPAHEHPGKWLPSTAVCKASIIANRGRLEKLLDIRDYAPEILFGEGEPAALIPD